MVIAGCHHQKLLLPQLISATSDLFCSSSTAKGSPLHDLAMSQALACPLPRACSVHRNVKMMAKICFLTPGLYALLSARCGVTAVLKGKGWKVRHLRSAISYFRQEGMAPAASCTQHSCVPDPTSARVLLHSRCTYLPKQIFIL